MHIPTNPIPREVINDYYIKDVKINKGTLINPDFLAIMYSPNTYEEPFEFKPERWIAADGTKIQPKPYTWLPFSAGIRSCIGRQLAEIDIKITVINLIKNYDIEFEAGKMPLMLDGTTFQPGNKTVRMRRRID